MCSEDVCIHLYLPLLVAKKKELQETHTHSLLLDPETN